MLAVVRCSVVVAEDVFMAAVIVCEGVMCEGVAVERAD
jgi:hypothetical protein